MQTPGWMNHSNPVIAFLQVYQLQVADGPVVYHRKEPLLPVKNVLEGFGAIPIENHLPDQAPLAKTATGDAQLHIPEKVLFRLYVTDIGDGNVFIQA